MFFPHPCHMTNTYLEKLTIMGSLIKPVMTTDKTKDMIPILRPKVGKEFQSNLVYYFKCS